MNRETYEALKDRVRSERDFQEAHETRAQKVVAVIGWIYATCIGILLLVGPLLFVLQTYGLLPAGWK